VKEYLVRLNFLGGAVLAAAVAATSLVTSVAVASRAYEGRSREASRVARQISVKGYARTRVRSDRAVWRVLVRGEARELREAFEVLERGTARVREFLAARGFPSGELEVSAIETTAHFARDARGEATREVVSHSLERAFTVTTGDLDRVAAAAGEVTGLLREGIEVVSSGPEYTYTRIADLKVRVLGEATRDARERADEIASRSGCRVSDVRWAQMGVLQITRPDSTEVSSSGQYDTSTVAKDVSVTVSAAFGLAEE